MTIANEVTFAVEAIEVEETLRAQLDFVRGERDDARADADFLRRHIVQMSVMSERAKVGSELERQMAASLLVEFVSQFARNSKTLLRAEPTVHHVGLATLGLGGDQ